MKYMKEHNVANYFKYKAKYSMKANFTHFTPSRIGRYIERKLMCAFHPHFHLL